MAKAHDHGGGQLVAPGLRVQTPFRIGVVIPCFKARNHILDVVRRIGPEVDAIYIVDDKCPEGSGQLVRTDTADPRIQVMFHNDNQGVGAAVLTGVAAALRDGMDAVVKIDSDGQMAPELISAFVRPIAEGIADVAKGNRFFNLDDVRAMPASRLFGNAMLSFLTKLSSGYWNLFDPTNGFIVLDARLLARIPLHKVDRGYFFESDLLFHLGLIRAKVVDVPMRAVYGNERSNLKISKEILPFLVRNLRNFAKRLFYNYFVRDFNVASLEFLFGVILSAFGIIYGLTHWGIEEPATAGTVMIAALPLLTGIILLVSFVNFDAQQVPREPISPYLPALKEREALVISRTSTAAADPSVCPEKIDEAPQWMKDHMD
jgi:dolichol-phosphate mannosyltransferase